MDGKDIFDSTLSLEETHKEEGYRQGFEDGILSGKQEAEFLGMQHGFAVGEELGFYSGCVQIWELAMSFDASLFSGRVQKSVRQIGEMVKGYPIMDPEDESSQDVLDAIRLKFRAVSASLGIRLEFPKSGDVSRAEF